MAAITLSTDFIREPWADLTALGADCRPFFGRLRGGLFRSADGLSRPKPSIRPPYTERRELLHNRTKERWRSLPRGANTSMPPDTTTRLSDRGSGDAHTVNTNPTCSTGIRDVGRQTFRWSYRWNRHRLRRSCESQYKGCNSNPLDHFCLL